MKIGVTGYKGRLGSWLVNSPEFGYTPIFSSILDEESLAKEVKDFDVIINCAALTDVDRCEHDEEYFKRARQVNVFGVEGLRRVFNGRLVHISTSYVFDGKKDFSYVETDIPNPIGSYGLTKFMSEQICHRVYKDKETCVVRIIDLFGNWKYCFKPDFVSKILASLHSGECFGVSNRMYRTPVSVPTLADILSELVEYDQELPKVLHVGSSDSLSKYEMSKLIAVTFSLPETLIFPTEDIVDGFRPLNASLDSSVACEMGFSHPMYHEELLKVEKQSNEELDNIINLQ